MNLDKILEPWTSEFQKAAVREGWDLFTATEGSAVQVQRCDDPDEQPDGAMHLPDDETAHLIVRTGTGPHHSAARKIIHDHFPAEWALLEAAAAKVSP